MTGKFIEIKDESKIEPMPSSVLALYEMNWREYLKRKNYNKDINKMCELCRAQQIKEHGEITIKCSGLKDINTFLPEEVLYSFNDEEIRKMSEMIDPYLWAENNLDTEQEDIEKRMLKHRWYQEQYIKCSATRKTIRCGRRAGKSFGIGIDAAHRLVEQPGYRILVVTPFLSQAKELSELVRTMLRKIPNIGTWDELVERSVTSPNHEIKLKNGSVFKAFTAGVSHAGSVRGQGADWIILDEADFLTQEAFNAVSAILADKPATELTCTSTPYGENILYKLSNSPEYREFHFPTFVLPHYNDDLDKDFRNQSDVAGYVQEIQAEYGLASNVVFQPEFIDVAKEDKSPDVSDYIINRNEYILALGCDWNSDKVGTRICIVGYHKPTGKFSTARLDNVAKEGWTQVAAIEKIVELNRQYLLDHIYVDEGFGESNVQHLKLRAVDNYGVLPMDHPDLRLDEVVAVNFSSTLELKDVVTGEVRKKYYKNFMVETVNRCLESGTLQLEGKRNEDLVKQMKNYIVKSTTSNGRKIYEAKDHEIGDHDLDAYMIAITAIHLEHDSILDKTQLSSVQILPVAKIDQRGYNNSLEITPRLSDSELRDAASSLFHSYKSSIPSTSRTDRISNGGVLRRNVLNSRTSMRSNLRLGR